MIPQERPPSSMVISLNIIGIFLIFHNQVIDKIKNFWSFFMFFSRQVFGLGNFYANQLGFSVKQCYTLSFVEIPVGMVTQLGDFT